MTDHAQHRTTEGNERHGRPYVMFWVNMILGLAVMYFVMFSMVDGPRDFRNNLNMFYMAVTMWAPSETRSMPFQGQAPCVCLPFSLMSIRSDAAMKPSVL